MRSLSRALVACITLVSTTIVGVVAASPAARATNTVPVVIVALENTEATSIINTSTGGPASGSCADSTVKCYTAFINCGHNTGLTDYSTSGFNCSGRVFTNFYATMHPSLPNYLMVTSGTNNGCTNDKCPTGGSIGCYPTVTASDCQTQNNLFNQMNLAGGTTFFRSYEESMPSACYQSNKTPYAVRHNPEPYYTDVTGASTVCTSTDVPYMFGTQPNPASLPRFSFITPNLCDDAHGINYKTGSPVSGLAATTGGSLASGTYQIETVWVWSGAGTAPNQTVHTKPDAAQSVSVPASGKITGTVSNATGLADAENIYVKGPSDAAFKYQLTVTRNSSFTISSLGSSTATPPTSGSVPKCGQGGLNRNIPTGPADNCTDPTVVTAELTNLRSYYLCLADNWLATNVGTPGSSGTLRSSPMNPDIILWFDEGKTNGPSPCPTGISLCGGGQIMVSALGPGFPHSTPTDATAYNHCSLTKGLDAYFGLTSLGTSCMTNSNQLTIGDPTDTTAPTAPSNLAVSYQDPSEVDLAWQASTDPDDAISSYWIFRDGVQIDAVPGDQTDDADLSPLEGVHTYAVEAHDSNGNVGSQVTISVRIEGGEQMNSCTSPVGGSSAASCSYPAATTAGNLLVVTLACAGGCSITAPSPWTLAAQSANSRASIYYCGNCASQTGSGSFSLGANHAWAMTVAEYASMATSGVLDKTATDYSGANTGATGDTGTTATTSQANEVVIAMVMQTAGNAVISETMTTTNGYGDGGAIVATPTVGGGITSAVVEDDLTGPNAGADTFYDAVSFAAADKWGGAIATFKANV